MQKRGAILIAKMMKDITAKFRLVGALVGVVFLSGSCGSQPSEFERVSFSDSNVVFEIESYYRGGTADNTFDIYLVSDAGRQLVFAGRGGGKPILRCLNRNIVEIRYEGGYYFELFVVRYTSDPSVISANPDRLRFQVNSLDYTSPELSPPNVVENKCDLGEQISSSETTVPK